MAASDKRSADEIVVLADESGSMIDIDGGNRERPRSRLDLVKEALATLPAGVRIIAFHDVCREIKSPEELRIGGGTALHLAIEKAATFSPVRTIIISDGEPDSEERATKAANELAGIIDVLYCGSPTNTHARAFLESLAKAGMGSYYETGDQIDVAKQLPAAIKGLLGK